MKKTFKYLFAALSLCTVLSLSSCDKWLDVSSDEEVFSDEAFQNPEGFRTALIGIYEYAASPALWGQELSWGFLSALSWNHTYGNAIPQYRNALNDGNYESGNSKAIIENIWKTAYKAIANCNNLIREIEDKDPAMFEYGFEKNMILAEAHGMRALLHFELLQLFVPAPVTGYNGAAIPYVTNYPDIRPETKSVEDFYKLLIEDLEFAMNTLKPIDVDEFWGKAKFVSGGTNLMTMNYFMQGVGNYNSTGKKRDNAYGNGFFCYRGWRLNYWSTIALLAKVYSYKRDFSDAEKYADMFLDNWTGNQNGLTTFTLNSTKPASASNYGFNRVDFKRCPEPILSFWNDNLCDNRATAVGTIYDQVVDFQYLFAGDETTDWRYTPSINEETMRYRLWDGQDYTQKNTGSDVIKYSLPIATVIELPEIYYIKAEALAEAGNIADAIKAFKPVRDARGCTRVLSATTKDEFVDLLVNEAQRNFIERGHAFTFLKKFDYKTIYNGTPAGFSVPDGWYTFPLPDSETAYY